MIDTGPLGRKQREHEIHGLTIDRPEIDRLVETQEGTDHPVEPIDSRMRQGNTMPDPGGAKAFTVLQRRERGSGINAIDPGDKVAEILKQAFLRGNGGYHLHGGWPKDFGKFHWSYTSIPTGVCAGLW